MLSLSLSRSLLQCVAVCTIACARSKFGVCVGYKIEKCKENRMKKKKQTNKPHSHSFIYYKYYMLTITNNHTRTHLLHKTYNKLCMHIEHICNRHCGQNMDRWLCVIYQRCGYSFMPICSVCIAMYYVLVYSCEPTRRTAWLRRLAYVTMRCWLWSVLCAIAIRTHRLTYLRWFSEKSFAIMCEFASMSMCLSDREIWIYENRHNPFQLAVHWLLDPTSIFSFDHLKVSEDKNSLILSSFSAKKLPININMNAKSNGNFIRSTSLFLLITPTQHYTNKKLLSNP